MSKSPVLSAPLKEAPSAVGGVRIEFRTGRPLDELPSVEEGVIIVPLPYEGMVAYPLDDGQQMLVYNQTYDRTFYIGIDDDAPFAVELDSDRWDNFLSGGEDEFYASLKPDIIARFEEYWGVKAVRQGNVWAVPVPGTWDAIEAYHARTGRTQVLYVDVESGEEDDVFQNGHVLKSGGRSADYVRLPADGDWGGSDHLTVDLDDDVAVVATGVLVTSDHPDLVMDQPHILAPTQGIRGFD